MSCFIKVMMAKQIWIGDRHIFFLQRCRVWNTNLCVVTFKYLSHVYNSLHFITYTLLSSIKIKKEHNKGWSNRLLVRSAGPGLMPGIYMVCKTFFNSSPRKSMSPSALLACLCALRCQGIHVDKIPTYIKC